jgi:lipopolysaccharide biosynthesis glycosyltransferase
MKIYIGHDPREQVAYDTCVRSLLRRSSAAVEITPLQSEKLQMSGLLRRPIDARGSCYDFISQAPQATDFAVSRFLVPVLAQTGFALFIDCDMVFLDDVARLFALADPQKAVQVVKCEHPQGDRWKMDSKEQTYYPRKNWSSVILWNCDHKANRRLSLDAINNWPGRDLHAFCWLHDDEIGELPAGWNWLVNVNRPPVDPCLAHFTLGGPWLPNWEPRPYDNLWLDEASG